MAKRSTAQSIRSKQSGPYSGLSRMVSIIAIGKLKSFPESRRFISEDEKDAQAEAIMNQGYSRRRNPICSSCYIQKAINGSCGCSN